jgi:hypothetical protein
VPQAAPGEASVRRAQPRAEQGGQEQVLLVPEAARQVLREPGALPTGLPMQVPQGLPVQAAAGEEPLHRQGRCWCCRKQVRPRPRTREEADG